MNASNPETIYSAGSEDCTQARLITVSGSARTVPMSHRDTNAVGNVHAPIMVFHTFGFWVRSPYRGLIYKSSENEL